MCQRVAAITYPCKKSVRPLPLDFVFIGRLLITLSEGCVWREADWYSRRFAWFMHSLQGSSPGHRLVRSAEKKRCMLYLMMNDNLLRCNEILNTYRPIVSILQYDVALILHYKMSLWKRVLKKERFSFHTSEIQLAS